MPPDERHAADPAAPLPSASAPAPAAPTVDFVSPAGGPDPLQLGPYRVLERVGEGGMGVVYKAEQRAGIRRTVAVKVIKLGMDTREVVARFAVERQALALMSHPGVARVFDAGVAQDGRPYFAMEYVPGVPLTRYCDQEKLSTRQRLDLFTQVCHAVQHAHQKGVIHRDLKPSNILVTLVDGQPVPKVIDFGIAKATGQRLTEHTLVTRAGAIIGTPEYVSPEQAQSGGLDIDTRTDVYALGVILYELLTGVLPFDPATLRKVGHDAIARHLREVDPAKPSTRLSAASAPAPAPAPAPPPATPPAAIRTLADLARARNTDPRSLVREVRGDLDWITLKALEKQRARRYQTAVGLAADIRRHLDHEPVLARPPTAAYHLAKFVRKHRVGVAAASLVGLACAAGAVGTAVGLVRAKTALIRAGAAEDLANGQRDLAQREARKATAVSDFVTRMLRAGSPGTKAGGVDVRVVEVLDKATAEAAARFADQPETEFAIRLTLGKAYYHLNSFGMAEENLYRGYELANLHGLASSPAYFELLSYYGWSMVNGRGDAGRAEAARFLRPPLAECARSLGPGHPATWDLADVYAAALSYQDPVAAERVYREWIRHVQAAPMRSDRLDRLVQHLGVALGMQGRHLNEDELYREAGVSVPLNHVAASGPTSRQSPSKGPEMVLRESVDEARRDYGESSRQLALAKQGLERFLTRQGRYDEAFVLSTEVTNYYRRLPASSGTTAAAHMMDTARAALRAGKDADAATLFAEAVQLWRTIEGGDAAAWNARCAVMETSLRFCDSKAWAGDAVRGTAFFAADGLVYGYHAKSGGLGDPGLSGLRFNLARWVGPSPSQSKTVVTGDAKALRALPDPKAGLYYLGLQVPRNGAEPLRIGQWVLFADWDVSLFGTEPGMPADPAKWAQRLAQPPDEARKRASLTFDEAALGNYGPGGRGESFGFVAKAAIDLPAGGYRFAARVNDGLRLRVDGKLLIDHWPVSDPGGEAWPYVYGDVQLAAGRHELRVEYFQDVGGSQLWLVAEPLPSVK